MVLHFFGWLFLLDLSCIHNRRTLLSPSIIQPSISMWNFSSSGHLMEMLLVNHHNCWVPAVSLILFLSNGYTLWTCWSGYHSLLEIMWVHMDDKKSILFSVPLLYLMIFPNDHISIVLLSQEFSSVSLSDYVVSMFTIICWTLFKSITLAWWVYSKLMTLKFNEIP